MPQTSPRHGQTPASPYEAFDRLSTPVWVLERNGLSRVYANTAAQRLFKEVRPGSGAWEALREAVPRLRPGQQSRFTVALDHTGPGHALLCTCSGIELEDGSSALLIEACKDDPEASALRFAEQRFRDYLETSADWLWETDMEQRFTYYSGQGLPEFGPDPVGQTRSEILTRIGAEPDLTPVIAQYMARGEAFRDLEYRMVRPHGEEIWVRLSGKPIHDPRGEIRGYRGSARDVTASKQVEMKLRERDARYRSIFENAVEGMYRTDRSGRYLEVNPALAHMHGCDSPETFLDRFPTSRPIYADPNARNRLVQEIAEQGFVFDFECEALRADGSRFIMSETAWAVRGSTGETLGYEGLIQDITERVEHRRALEQARNEALQASRAKSDFLAHMSHELRTPLNAVIGFSEAMMQGVFGPLGSANYEDYCRYIHQSGVHLLRIINDILDLSKIEAGRFELHRELLDLADIAFASRDMISPLAEKNGVQLAIDVPDPAPSLVADERAVRQILVNLLSNAVKFTPRGGRVTLRLRARAGGGAELVVADEGIGMTENEVVQALQPFRQVDNILNRRFEGTGLGLSVVKAFTEMHGGTLTIDSEPGRGSVLTVALP